MPGDLQATPAPRLRVGVSEAIDLIGFGKFQAFLGFSVGMSYVADSVEMLLLSILGPALKCSSWQITDYQQASLTTVVFMGMLFGSPIFGVMADKYGRRATLMTGTLFLVYFGILTTFAPTFEWILLLRFCVGFYIGAMPQACTLLVEYVPSNYRGKGVMILALWWAMGGILLALTAWVVMPAFGWRALVGISVIPLIVFLLTSPYCPESPLYLAATGKETEVYTQINRIAWSNGKRTFFDDHELIFSESTPKRVNFFDLFQRDRLKTTMTVLLLWFVAALAYYGSVLMGTTMLDSSNHLCGRDDDVTLSISSTDGEHCSVNPCIGLTKEDYVKILWTTAAEFPGTLLAIGVVDVIGRKYTILIFFMIYSLSIFALAACWVGKGYLLVFLFIARGMSLAMFQLVYVYTPEVYPTNLRAAAMGAGSSCARIGAMLTPFIANVLVKKSIGLAVSLYGTMGLFAAIVVFFFVPESKYADLSDSSNQMDVAPGKTRLTNSQIADNDM